MRYPKGSVVVTRAGDIPLLRLVRNCRFIGHQQLFELLQHDAVESSRGSFNWRVRRLLKAGRIERVNDVLCDGYSVYTINQNGLIELESQQEFAIALHSGTRQMPDRAQVFHALELNAIRLSLVRSALLVSWQSEIEISSWNMVSPAPYQKDYDAIVKVWVGDEVREFALEYEHSLKNTKQYERVRAALEAERRGGFRFIPDGGSRPLDGTLVSADSSLQASGFPDLEIVPPTTVASVGHNRQQSSYGHA